VKITAVYPATGAQAAGVRVGDVLLSIDDPSTTSKATFGSAIRHRDLATVTWRP
jgi:S1-C subfamily serine protease